MRWVACAWLVACGRIGFDAHPPDAEPPDAPSGPFASPTLITTLSSGFDEDDPTLTGDQLEIFFESTQNASFDLYTATRPSIADPWSVPTLVAELDSAVGEACPEVSTDGLTLLFSSARPGGMGAYDLYIATRATRTTAWSAPVRVPELESTADDYCAVIASSGLEVVFHSRRPGTGGRDLYRATRATPASPWNPPTEISELDSPGDDESGFFLAGDLELMFGSNRGTDRDIYTATRADVGSPFGPPVAVTSLNSESDDSDPWLSPDGHTIVFSSNRSGVGEIWQATR